MSAGNFSFPIMVYYEDTDSGRIVYYANYLKFAERARTELLREHGFDHKTLAREHGIGFAVRHCSADYKRPAVLDDALEVRTTVTAVGGASMNMDQAVCRDGDVLVDLKIRLASIDGQGAPARIPADLRTAMKALCTSAENETNERKL